MWWMSWNVMGCGGMLWTWWDIVGCDVVWWDVVGHGGHLAAALSF